MNLGFMYSEGFWMMVEIILEGEDVKVMIEKIF